MKAARILLIVLILAGAVMACITGGGGDTDPAGSGPSAADVTATYGAEQFHTQLTAQAAGGEP